MILRSVVVVVCAGLSAGAASAGGEMGGGISDISIRATRSGAQKIRANALERERGGAGAQADERDAQSQGESSVPTPGVQAVVQPAAIGCDFGGFPDRDQVATAYAGGTSASGVSRQNFGVSFSGAVVLNTFNGSGAPNPGVIYAPGSGAGRIVAAFTQFDAVNVEFSYASKVPLQLAAYASANGTGSPIATFAISPNITTAGGFATWAQFSQALPAGTRSLSFEGPANFWGIDAFVATGQLSGGAVAEFYNTEGCGGTSGTGWASTFAAMSQPAITLTNLSSLSGVGALFINNYNNCGAGPMIASKAILENFVRSGGVLVVHDRWGTPNSWVPGAAGIVSTRDPGANIDRGAAAAEFVDGVSGSISNSDLDGGNYSHHGYMCTGLPSGAKVVLTQGSCAVAVAYPLGSGWVYYSTIPLDFYQAGRGTNPPRDNFVRYAQNVARTMIARTRCPAPTSASDDCNANGQSDACEIARGLVKDCNGNGIPDGCEIAGLPFSATRSGVLATDGGTVYTTFGGTPRALGDVTLRLEATADMDNGPGEGIEFVLFTAGGGKISVKLVGPNPGPDCTTQVRNVVIPSDVFNAARATNGDLVFAIQTGPNTNNFCGSTGWRIDMSYTFGERDCNTNGVPDSCELASGAAIDQNGNGVPDSCDPYPTLTLTANAGACNSIGSQVDVDARLSGVLNRVVAGQLVLEWDPAKLELVASNAGDAPYVSSYLVNNSSGNAVILVSAAPGGGGTTAPSVIVSRLRFRVLGGSCDGTGTAIRFGTFGGILSTEFTDGFGASLVPSLIGSNGFVVDDGAPVISNVPANIFAQAFAGEGGFALIPIGTPTVSDACAPGLVAVGVRSDGRALSAPWPSGTTSVRWTATDPCGNSSSATTVVTVDPTNRLDLTFVGTPSVGGAARSLVFAVRGTRGTVDRIRSVGFDSAGSATASLVDLPVDDYHCVLVEEPTRSLRRRMPVTDGGVVWVAGPSDLVLGDIINDEVIDVLDWGAYIVRNVNADLNGDGVINSQDGNIILANFGRAGDAACGAYARERAPVTAVSVSDLVAMGLPELAGADLNGDGWVDGVDMDLAGD